MAYFEGYVRRVTEGGRSVEASLLILALMFLALMFLALIVVDLVAMKWGSDSRPADRENTPHQAL